MNVEIKIGDKVKLNTGQDGLPVMIVDSFFGMSKVVSICKWYDSETKSYKKEHLNIASLIKVD